MKVLNPVFAFMGMTELNYRACRNLVSSVLHQAIKDVAYGPPEEGERAQWWIDGPNAKHLTELMNINACWPPDKACYARERKAYLKRREAHAGMIYGAT